MDSKGFRQPRSAFSSVNLISAVGGCGGPSAWMSVS
jgi:hypothetical protein